jgi:DNA-binding MarR family transcriptional regulator
MKPADVHAEFGPTSGALGALYGPAIQAHLDDLDLRDGWYFLAVAHDFKPDPATPERFVARTPYAARRRFEDGLSALAERGLMARSAAGEYRITASGQAAFDSVMATVARSLGEIAPPIAPDWLTRLVDLLDRLVAACLAAPEPAEKPCLATNRNSDPGPSGPPALRVLQLLADMNAFRDDAHLAAWRPYGTSGHTWEAFTYLWRGDARTADELADKLAVRRFSAEDYSAALDELAARGWIEPAPDGGWQLTAEGQAARQTAEDETDRLYYAPWAALTEPELAELGEGLAALRTSLEALDENAGPGQ